MLVSANNTKIVGKKTALFLNQSNIDPLDVHCIGHSLGAHTCGFVGKYSKLGRISGLDPAGAEFYLTHQRLAKKDALFVDVIHSSIIAGLQESIGDQDFFPNGGKTQRGF